jgi:hypothetical protein
MKRLNLQQNADTCKATTTDNTMAGYRNKLNGIVANAEFAVSLKIGGVWNL